MTNPDSPRPVTSRFVKNWVSHSPVKRNCRRWRPRCCSATSAKRQTTKSTRNPSSCHTQIGYGKMEWGAHVTLVVDTSSHGLHLYQVVIKYSIGVQLSIFVVLALSIWQNYNKKVGNPLKQHLMLDLTWGHLR